MITKLHIKWQK